MNFQPVTLDSRSAIIEKLLSVPLPICDFAFANLYGWALKYKTEWAILGTQTLVIRFYSSEFNCYCYMLPHCKNCDSWISAIDTLKKDACLRESPLVFYGIPQEMEQLKLHFPNDFEYRWEGAAVDYVYAREKLELLAGKKLQPKRNHINKFNKLYPNYTYEALQKLHVDECLNFVERWRAADNAYSESFDAEYVMIERVLYGFDDLQLKGGIIRVDNEIVAFTIASQLNENTYDIHVEKALPQYEGSYAKINNEFVRTLPQAITYINREEDLGLPGLRRAKESYHPDLLLAKGVAILKDCTI